MDELLDAIIQGEITAREAVWESDPTGVHERDWEEIFTGKFTGKHGKYKPLKTNKDSNILTRTESGSNPLFIIVTAIFPHF